MAIKVYISGICGSQEVRKQQQRVLFILQSLPIDLQVIDVTEPERGEDLIFMQETAKKHDKKTQLPPQIFNDNEYCGDYEDFELANDDDEIMKFLKLETGTTASESITQNGFGNHETDKEAIIENLEANDTVEKDSIIDQNESNPVVNEEIDTSAVANSGDTQNETSNNTAVNDDQKDSSEAKVKESEEEESEEESD